MIVNLASLTLLSKYLETCARRKIKFSGDFLGIPVFREGYICALILFNLVIKSIKIVHAWVNYSALKFSFKGYEHLHDKRV